MTRLASIYAALALFASSLVPAQAGPAQPASFLAPPAMLVSVAGDCHAIGQQVAAQNGGTLARASAERRGSQTVCVIVVLVPAKDGQRPRREEIVVPM